MKKPNYNRVTRFREAWVWLKEEEKLYAQFLKGYHPIIHLFCGKSSLGDVRVDCEDFPNVTHRIEIKPEKGFKLPFEDKSFDACIFDPPWINPMFVWTAWEVPRITRRRIVAITGCHWWEPQDKGWKLTALYVLKRISPNVRLVFVYDFVNQTLESATSP